ncbi:Aste57867_14403 [Aphanomyces stellatus]|uniref:Aste57867_14403 protein n=1 Tax=Aphanomyces stellatus TaxID=120398 RepID=A0A485L0K6_9STRA|nr:hypothetical protein As57867_014349 [Aphanomyces stellatus]VFT91225.1 Aste57867_14403 [Aphanomyces stellatus]
MVAVTVSEDEKKLEKEFLSKRPPLAYAKLAGKLGESEKFEALITQLPVDLGRGSLTEPTSGKICLGEQMSVSRVHARINWNAEKTCFELECLGKNGLFAGGAILPHLQALIVEHLAGHQIAKEGIVQLTPRMPLKIGNARVYFLPSTKSPCGVLSGFKLIQKGFEKAMPGSATSGLTVDETIDSIYKCFRDIEDEVGGRDNLAALIKGYFEQSPASFRRVSLTATGEPRYAIIKPEKTDEDKKRPGSAVVDAKKKQKMDVSPTPAPEKIDMPRPQDERHEIIRSLLN